ncbi:MAG: hypothetical protein K1X53_01095 [Candidatus Sumerlaeaceae bacterium]|nr:hypothetical protein [Candidatus Sumerlaeaceae bacterium]
MTVTLRDIPGHEPSPLDKRRFVAVVIGGKSPAIEELNEWRKSAPEHYRRIMAAMKKVARMDRPYMGQTKLVEKSSRDKLPVGIPAGSEVFELKGIPEPPRLFFFHLDTVRGPLAVCLSGYHKTTGSGRRQDGAFDAAGAIRNRFFSDIIKAVGDLK